MEDNVPERNPMPCPQPLAVQEEAGKRVCGAKCRNGRSCTQKPMRNGRCRMHGGLTPAGAASPHFVHGRRSRYLKNLPGEMMAGYRAACDDPDITSLREELSLQTVRIQQLLGRLSETQTPPWGSAVEALNDLKTARGKDARAAALAELEKIVRTGADAAQSQEATWEQLRDVIQERTRTAAAEWKRLSDLGAFVETDKALAFLKGLLRAAKEILGESDTYRQLNRRLLELLPPPNEPTPIRIG